MEYRRYSPFQFNTPEQLYIPAKELKKEHAQYRKMCDDSNRKTKDLGCTMPIGVAHSVSSTPTAYISPNSPDVRRQLSVQKSSKK